MIGKRKYMIEIQEIKEVGEQYCLEQLIIMDKNAHRAKNPNQKTWDIKILEGKKEILVQVKTIVWKTMKLKWKNKDFNFFRKASSKQVIKGQFKNNKFDYLVVVCLNLNGDVFTSYVIPSNKLQEKNTDGSEKETLISNGSLYYSFAISSYNGGYKDQSISISTLKHKKVQEKFQIFLDKFCLIT